MAAMKQPGRFRSANILIRATTVSTFILPALLAWNGLSQDQKPPATLAELQQRLEQHISQAKYGAALWGVKISSLDSGKTLFEHNPQKLCSPASNCKLYTVALALDQLGPDYRIRTSLYAKSRPGKSGKLSGDLVLYGRGDPTINARLQGGDIYQALAPLVAALTNAGVKRIAGDLVADESYFRGPPFGSGWMWDDLEYYYGAEISALTINDNVLQAVVKPGAKAGAPCGITLSPTTTLLTLSNRTATVASGERKSIHLYRPLEGNLVYVSGQMPIGDAGYTNEVTLHEPARLFASLFKEALARHGIKVGGRLRVVNWLDRQASPLDYGTLVELGYVESLPMRDMAREVQKPSQNLYTDLLLAHVGERTRDADSRPIDSSEDLGVRALNKFLAGAAIQKGETFFEEGSGLARDNMASPNATVALLKFMSQHKCAEAYIAALPVAGVDGTLRNRMKGTPAAGNVRAKTGTLRWANSLSGYVTTAAGEHLVFSLMLNRYYELRPARGDLDTIAVMLAGFTGRGN
jgi:serine-type D-Ala-D-Ala carboxypeptidase/endopeptidase (penicillin-binding protein 4)